MVGRNLNVFVYQTNNKIREMLKGRTLKLALRNFKNVPFKRNWLCIDPFD